MLKTTIDVILVEDNPADIEITLDAFRENRLANKIIVLKDGQEAIDYIFKQKEYNNCAICEQSALILLDFGRPKIDGIEVLKHIRSDDRTKNMPVIALVSSHLDQDRIKSLHLEVNGYIVKPIEFASFARAVIRVGHSWALLSDSSY